MMTKDPFVVYDSSMDYTKPETVEKNMKKITSLIGEIVDPDDKILIKPNLATDRHRYGWDPRSIMANGTVINPIVKHFAENKIVIADDPIADADFNEILRITQLDKVNVPIWDLRSDYYPKKAAKIVGHTKLVGDPLGYALVDLGKDSEFFAIREYWKHYRSTSGPEPSKPLEVHDETRNIYSIPKSILDADVVISVAKLKTHKKVGVTLTIKNMIGLTNRKDWLPHYRTGAPPAGDEYPKETLSHRIEHVVHKHVPFLSDRQIRGANWYGSDTVWRASVDLMKILLYADKDGTLRTKQQRKFFSVIDGVIGGERQGPLAPTPKYCGVLVGGFTPVSVDATCARIMGFHPEQIKIISQPALLKKYSLGKFPSAYPDLNFNFQPPENWEGHI